MTCFMNSAVERVLRDVNGDAIGVTDKTCCTTPGLLDSLTPSFGDDMFRVFPQDVAGIAVQQVWILEKAQGTIAIAHRIVTWTT